MILTAARLYLSRKYSQRASIKAVFLHDVTMTNQNVQVQHICNRIKLHQNAAMKFNPNKEKLAYVWEFCFEGDGVG